MEIKRDFIFDPSLVLYLPLYRLDGDSVLSQDVYGHLCTVTGAVWRPYGREFDGTDDKVSLSHAVFDLGGSDFTLMMWFNMADLTQSHGMISGSVNFKGVGLRWYVGTETVRLNLSSNGSSWDIANGVDGAKTTWTQDLWYFLTLVRRGSLWEVLVDQVSDLSLSDSSPLVSHEGIFLGSFIDIAPYFLSGEIGEVFLYTRALSFSEIQHNYEATKWRYR